MKAILYASVLFCFCSTGYAGGESLPELARMEVASKLATFSDSIEECQKGKAPIAKSAFSRVSLSDDQLKTVLKYHMSKSNYECSKNEINEFLLSSSILAYIDGTASDGVLAGNELIIHDAVTMFKLKPDYMAIPSDQREIIESIPGLKKPFDLVKTAQNLGL